MHDRAVKSRFLLVTRRRDEYRVSKLCFGDGIEIGNLGMNGWMDRLFFQEIFTFHFDVYRNGVYGVNDEILGISVSTNISRTSLIKSSPLDIPSHDENFEIYYFTLSFTRETKIIYKSYKYEFSSLGTCLLKDILYN